LIVGFDYCLASSVQYFIRIQDENKLCKMYKLYTCRCIREVCQLDILTATEKSMDSWSGTNISVFCSVYNAPIIVRNLQKRYITYQEPGTLQQGYTPICCQNLQKHYQMFYFSFLKMFMQSLALMFFTHFYNNSTLLEFSAAKVKTVKTKNN